MCFWLRGRARVRTCVRHRRAWLRSVFSNRSRSQQAYTYNTRAAIIFHQAGEQDFAAARGKKWSSLTFSALLANVNRTHIVRPSAARSVLSGGFEEEPVVLIEPVERCRDTTCQWVSSGSQAVCANYEEIQHKQNRKHFKTLTLILRSAHFI